MMVIVPNELSDAINSAIDSALAECPEAAQDRAVFYGQLLAYFNEHGEIPQFSLARRGAKNWGDNGNRAEALPVLQ